MSELVIDTDVPIPAREKRRTSPPKSYLPWRQLWEAPRGASFAVACPGEPGSEQEKKFRRAMSVRISQAARRMGFKMTSRLITEDGKRVVRVWKV